jgi:hypothetical protein
MRLVNARHEAWRCAALLEQGIPIALVTLFPPRTYWGPPEDVRIDAIIALVPQLALPEHPSAQDRRVLEQHGADVVAQARPAAKRLVEEIDPRRVQAIADSLLVERTLDGEQIAQIYGAAGSDG